MDLRPGRIRAVCGCYHLRQSNPSHVFTHAHEDTHKHIHALFERQTGKSVPRLPVAFTLVFWLELVVVAVAGAGGGGASAKRERTTACGICTAGSEHTVTAAVFVVLIAFTIATVVYSRANSYAKVDLFLHRSQSHHRSNVDTLWQNLHEHLLSVVYIFRDFFSD